jgi:hypothetical protein
MTVDADLYPITQKFYPTEEDRQRKFNKLSGEMTDFYDVMSNIINNLYLNDIKFVVFDMQPNENPPRIHVGMTMCCEKKAMGHKVSNELRCKVTEQIKSLTRYKDVKWEI